MHIVELTRCSIKENKHARQLNKTPLGPWFTQITGFGNHVKDKEIGRPDRNGTEIVENRMPYCWFSKKQIERERDETTRTRERERREKSSSKLGHLPLLSKKVTIAANTLSVRVDTSNIQGAGNKV